MFAPRSLLPLALLALFGCSRASATKSADGYETLVLRYEGSASQVTIAELAEDLGYLAPIKLQYVGNNATGGPHSIQAVVTGDLDVGGSFNGSIIKLVAAKAPLKAIISGYGIDEQNFAGFYVLEKSAIREPRDLIGKTVAMNTLGAHSEYVLREYLARSGLTAAEVEQVTMIALPSVNAELSLRDGQVDVVALNTIFRDRALERGGIRMLFSDYSMFGSFNAGSIVMSTKFIESHPNVVRKYVDAVGRAFDWTNSTPRERVVARFEAIIRKRKRNEDTSVVRHWTGTGVKSKRGVLADRDFQLWIDWLVRERQLVQGQVSPRDIYTNAFQPGATDNLSRRSP